MIEHSKPTIGKKEQEAVADVFKTNYLAEGEVVRKFEEKLGIYIGAKGGVATSTGTLALYLALVSLGIKPDDEIIIPSYVCRSVLNSILYSGAKPVLCDVNKEDYNISFNDAKKKVTKRTRAIIIPHMFGCPAEIGSFVSKFKGSGIYLIEDCAHSIGAEYEKKKVGSFGDLSIFSFEGTKYIVTGEGGMVLANNNIFLDKLRRLKEPDSLGFKIKYTYRMTNLQAAIGIVQLMKLPYFIKRRRDIARIYNKSLSNLGIVLPKEYPERLHIFHRYMVKIEGSIRKFMQNCYRKGIKVKQPVKPYPIHKYLNLPNKDFSNTESIMKSVVSIPIYPLLKTKEIKLIIDVISSELKRGQDNK